jgi:3'-phosphoadenosine 5'-phosphosulfate sulfotransferase (PAPS reductase)/FAD synthetase
MQREPNTEYILSLSYGKDSLACLEAIKQLGYPLDRIVHAEVWATDTIPADLPHMIDFKAHADKIIKEKYGYTVEHICAVRGGGKKLTYDTQFYEWINEGRNKDRIYGFPYTLGAWCNSRLKVNVLQSIARENNLRKTVLSYTQETEEASNGRGELVYPTQTAGFLAAPLHKGRRKILCSTSELLLMSQSELRDILFRVKCYHS